MGDISWQMAVMILSSKHPVLKIGYVEREFLIPGHNGFSYTTKDKRFKIPILIFKAKNKNENKTIDMALKDLENMKLNIITSVEYYK